MHEQHQFVDGEAVHAAEFRGEPVLEVGLGAGKAQDCIHGMSVHGRYYMHDTCERKYQATITTRGAVGSFPFDDQVNDGRVADVDDLVPGDAAARKAAARREIDIARAFLVRDPHAATADRVAEVRGVEMALGDRRVHRGRERHGSLAA
jgi:hypothetical protein